MNCENCGTEYKETEIHIILSDNAKRKCPECRWDNLQEELEMNRSPW